MLGSICEVFGVIVEQLDAWEYLVSICDAQLNNLMLGCEDLVQARGRKALHHTRILVGADPIISQRNNLQTSSNFNKSKRE